ncbi:MAG: hypothetical protein ACK2UJ_21925, partial [Candidatus Promineifilaceae bacterium]
YNQSNVGAYPCVRPGGGRKEGSSMKGLLTSIVLFALLIPMVASATADSTAPPAVVNKNSAERAALMSLYNSTDIIGWYENTG